MAHWGGGGCRAKKEQTDKMFSNITTDLKSFIFLAVIYVTRHTCSNKSTVGNLLYNAAFSAIFRDEFNKEEHKNVPSNSQCCLCVLEF